MTIDLTHYECDRIVCALKLLAGQGGDIGDLEIAEIRELMDKITALEGTH